MKNHLRTVKAALILSLMLFGIVSVYSTGVTAADRQKFFVFNSYLTVSWDDNDLNQPIQINQVLSIPLNIAYSTDVVIPKIIASPAFPFTLRNRFYFGSAMPQGTIHLKVLDVPSWANIYFSTADHDVNIPLQGETPATINVSLYISPLREAPSEPFDIKFTIEAEQKGRVLGKTQEYTINFKPAYIPEISVTIDQPTRLVGPREPVNVQVKIKNNANYYTIVRHELINIPNEWSPVVNPSKIDIPPGDEQTVIVSVTPPYNFGWHDETVIIQVDFIPEASPGGGTPGPAVPVYIKLNNRGFAIPGFELIVFFIALGLIMILYQRQRKIK